MTAAALFLAIWAALLVAGDTRVGRVLRSAMIGLPLKALSRITRVHVAIAAVILMLLSLEMVAGGNDPLRMIALAAPDLALWLASIELGAVLDASMILASVYALVRRAGIGGRAKGNTRPAGPAITAKRARRAHRHRIPTPPANDEDPDAKGIAHAA